MGGILCLLFNSGRVLTPIGIISPMPRYLCDLVHDKFCIVLYERLKPMGGGQFPMRSWT